MRIVTLRKRVQIQYKSRNLKPKQSTFTETIQIDSNVLKFFKKEKNKENPYDYCWKLLNLYFYRFSEGKKQRLHFSFPFRHAIKII